MLEKYPHRRYGLLMALATGLFWGCIPILVKYALPAFSPVTIASVRMLTAFMFLLALLSYKKMAPLEILKAPPILAIFAGIFLAGNYFGYTFGVFYSGPSTTQIVIQLSSLLFIVFGSIAFKEKISLRQGFGIMLTFLGIFIFLGDQRKESFSFELYNMGFWYVVFAAVSWALYACFQKAASKDILPQRINIIVFAVAALVLLPSGEFQALAVAPLPRLVVLLLLGIATLLAYGTFAEAVRYAPVTEASLIVVINPIITLAAMYGMSATNLNFVPPETLKPLGYIGALLVLSGIVLSLKRERV